MRRNRCGPNVGTPACGCSCNCTGKEISIFLDSCVGAVVATISSITEVWMPVVGKVSLAEISSPRASGLIVAIPAWMNVHPKMILRLACCGNARRRNRNQCPNRGRIGTNEGTRRSPGSHTRKTFLHLAGGTPRSMKVMQTVDATSKAAMSLVSLATAMINWPASGATVGIAPLIRLPTISEWWVRRRPSLRRRKRHTCKHCQKQRSA